jgi:hypothetical protein
MDIFHADHSHSEKSEEIQCCNFYDDDNVSFNIHSFFHLSLAVVASLGHLTMFYSVIYHSHFSSIFPRNFLCAATDAVQVYASRHTCNNDLTRFISSFGILLLFTFLQPMAIEHKTREQTLIW